MAKAATKKRRLKRTIRKTLGTLFLVSAIVVAAIPVDGLQAAGSRDVSQRTDVTKVTVTSQIPAVPTGKITDQKIGSYTVYGDYNGIYRYVVTHDSSTEEVAIVVGYNDEVGGSTLTIPDTLDAYLPAGANENWCAVNKKGNLLFYQIEQPKRDENNEIITQEVTGGDGIPTRVPVMEKVYLPCYYADAGTWKALEETDTLYYYDGVTAAWRGDDLSAKTPVPASLPDDQRLKNIKLRYIGNQHIKNNTDGTSEIVENSQAAGGVFSSAKNCSTLILGKELTKIGNYAFYGNGNINSLSFNDYMNEIGNYAFADCFSISSISMPDNAAVSEIGDHAFYNCSGLTSFNAPKLIARIGDSAFEACTSLTGINLCGTSNASSLQAIGNYAFAGCTSLRELIFPPTYAESNIPLSVIENCHSLQHVYAQHQGVNFVEDRGKSGTGYYNFKDFRDELEEYGNQTFYFEGVGTNALYTTAVDNYFAYKFSGEETFVKKVPDEQSAYTEETGSYEKNAVFTVKRTTGDSGSIGNGQITQVAIDPGMENLQIPGHVGPLNIVEIGASGFADNCDLKSVVIPETILTIGDNAFRGAHNLVSVVFENAGGIQSIGANAFKTQEYKKSGHSANCSTHTVPDVGFAVLTFTGDIDADYAPFQYAMNEANTFTNGTQEPTLIKYFSGWPTNLTVVRDTAAHKNTLTNYPTIKELVEGTEFTESNYPYMTLNEEYEDAAKSAFSKYLGIEGGEITGYEQQIIDNTLHVVLPSGIEAIAENLFVDKETAELGYLDTYLNKDADTLVTNTGKPVGKEFTTHLQELPSDSFDGCLTLETININGSTAIGDEAFKDCKNLYQVWIDPVLTTMGKTPFVGCDKLGRNETDTVHFQDNPNFACETPLIYGKAADGSLTRVLEYLNGTDNVSLSAEELASVTEVAPWAFSNTKIETADFTSSRIDSLPEGAFAETSQLYRVDLPYGTRTVGRSAFKNSAIRQISMPITMETIGDYAFDGVDHLILYSPEDCYAYRYANDTANPNIEWAYAERMVYYTVEFYYTDENNEAHLVHSEYPVKTGETVDVAKLLEKGAFEEVPAEINGKVFTNEWSPKSNYVQVNSSGSETVLRVYAVYEVPTTEKHWVSFYTQDNKLIAEYEIAEGSTIAPPAAPAIEGYTFSGWECTQPLGKYSVSDMASIKEDTIFRALYSKNDSTGGDSGNGSGSGGTVSGNNPGDPNNPNNPNNPNGNGSGSGGTGSGNNPGDTNNPNNSGSGPAAGDYYTLTVRNGSGSGSYLKGAQAIIVANDPASGMVFDKWTIEPSDAAIASTAVSATVVTMPESNVTVTANYKKGSGSSVHTGTGNTATGNSSRYLQTGSVRRGSTVVIDKNGLSNTGVVSATVNGSSDNFVIKVTESSAASEAAVKALMAEYGDLNGIEYFPMDISLYDSTGTNKITDTSGLSVTITLPLPDSLINYAGNNQVAGVVNDRLDKLSARFTTISGVSCITFTATHFSPYVIYVDTGHLTSGTADNTPKTGDGIHPKWFLSIGLACVSMVLFMKRDKKTATRRRMA